MNEIPDINADRATGKRNLVVRLGKERAGTVYIVLLILCFASIFAIVPFGVPVFSAIFSVILIPLIVSSILTIKRQGLNSYKVQEALSLKTMLIDHLITIIYTISFLAAGIGSAISTSQIGFIVLVYLFVFSLEGIGILSSKAVLSGRIAVAGK